MAPMIASNANQIELTRRGLIFAGGSAAALATLTLTGCSGSTNGADGDGGAGDVAPDPDRPKESPELTELVESGELDALEDRLPTETDRLIVDTPEYGIYGGVYQGAVLGQGDHGWLDRIINYEPIVRASPGLEEVDLPGTLKAVDVNEDASEFVLHLREGMRWSDGEPVTADDVIFAIEDVFLNEALYPNVPPLLQVESEPCSAERIDEHTVRLSYPGSKGDFFAIASRGELSNNLLGMPKHYLKDLLPEYNANADDFAEDEGYSDWVDHWSEKVLYFNNPERPVLTAWVVSSPLNEGSVVVAERNPYFWKTDDDGAQLPFIDRLEFEIIQDEEVMLLKAVNGEIDFHSRHFNSDPNRPVLAEARETGQFEFVDVEGTSMNKMVIALNLNHSDDELREIFQNRDFRIGLSHAIDRQDIIDTVYQRQGEPWQVAPHPDSEFFDEEFAKQYTEYDVDLANDHLDAAGLVETDSGGFRLLPSGERLTFQIDTAAGDPQAASALDMVSRFWEAVGVQARANPLERTLFYDRKSASANQSDATIWSGDGGLRVEMDETRWWFPSTGESNFARRWAEYYTSRGSGEYAEEPPAEVLEQMELGWQIPVEPDLEEQDAMFRRILEISKEQFFTIGIALPGTGYGIVRNRMRNVAESYTDSPVYYSPGHVNPPMWFIDE